MSFSSKISDFWSNLDIKIENSRKILKFLIKKLRIWVKIEHQFLIFSSFSTYFKPVTWGRLGCRFRFEKQKIQVQVTGLGLIFLTGWAKPQVEIGLRRLQVQTLISPPTRHISLQSPCQSNIRISFNKNFQVHKIP